MGIESNTEKKMIVVLGATGQQGGAVARALAASGQWHIRTLSRNPRSEASQRLIKSGVEEIAGDELVRAEIAAAFARQRWYPGLPMSLPRGLLGPLPGEIRKMFEWFGSEGYRADLPALRASRSDLMTFDQWLSVHDGKP